MTAIVHALIRRSTPAPTSSRRAIVSTTTVLAFAVALCWPVKAHAQVNIETLGDLGTARKVATSIDLRLEYRSGNVDHSKLDVDVRTDVRTQRAHSFVLLRGGVGLLGGERFANEGLAHLRVMIGSGRVVPEAFVQGDYDKSRRLDARVLGGGGFRLTLYESPKRVVAWGSSWMLEHERYDLDANAQHDTRTTAHRWSNYIVVRRNFGANASISWTAYAQPRFDAFDDVRVLTDATVGVGITSTLAMTTTFHLRHDSKPPDDIEDLDVALATGLQIVF